MLRQPVQYCPSTPCLVRRRDNRAYGQQSRDRPVAFGNDNIIAGLRRLASRRLASEIVTRMTHASWRLEAYHMDLKRAHSHPGCVVRTSRGFEDRVGRPGRSDRA